VTPVHLRPVLFEKSGAACAAGARRHHLEKTAASRAVSPVRN
jgi:hypothetical protein